MKPFKNRRYTYFNEKTKETGAGYKYYVTPMQECEMQCSDNTFDIVYDLLEEFVTSEDLDKKFKAVAKCDDRDFFNPKIGRSVAVAKSDMKYHKYMQGVYKKVLNRLQSVYDEMKELSDRHEQKCINCNESIKKYMGDEDE